MLSANLPLVFALSTAPTWRAGQGFVICKSNYRNIDGSQPVDCALATIANRIPRDSYYTRRILHLAVTITGDLGTDLRAARSIGSGREPIPKTSGRSGPFGGCPGRPDLSTQYHHPVPNGGVPAKPRLTEPCQAPPDCLHCTWVTPTRFSARACDDTAPQFTVSSSRCLARAMRLLIVPSLQEHNRAVSAYERPLSAT